MAECPNINFGVPTSGADEFSIQSGRELLRCGSDCVKLYITNVTMEKNTINYTCDSIDDAIQSGGCLQSAQLQYRDQNVVNWVSKEGANSSLANGNVITRAYCSGNADMNTIYTHTEGSCSVRLLINAENLADAGGTVLTRHAGGPAGSKLTGIPGPAAGASSITLMDWILSDASVNLSPTAWQAGTLTYQGFARLSGGSTNTYRVSFNWENGRYEQADGYVVYDDSAAPADLQDIISALLLAGHP